MYNDATINFVINKRKLTAWPPIDLVNNAISETNGKILLYSAYSFG